MALSDSDLTGSDDDPDKSSGSDSGASAEYSDWYGLNGDAASNSDDNVVQWQRHRDTTASPYQTESDGESDLAIPHTPNLGIDVVSLSSDSESLLAYDSDGDSIFCYGGNEGSSTFSYDSDDDDDEYFSNPSPSLIRMHGDSFAYGMQTPSVASWDSDEEDCFSDSTVLPGSSDDEDEDGFGREDLRGSEEGLEVHAAASVSRELTPYSPEGERQQDLEGAALEDQLQTSRESTPYYTPKLFGDREHEEEELADSEDGDTSYETAVSTNEPGRHHESQPREDAEEQQDEVFATPQEWSLLEYIDDGEVHTDFAMTVEGEMALEKEHEEESEGDAVTQMDIVVEELALATKIPEAAIDLGNEHSEIPRENPPQDRIVLVGKEPGPTTPETGTQLGMEHGIHPGELEPLERGGYASSLSSMTMDISQDEEEAAAGNDRQEIGFAGELSLNSTIYNPSVDAEDGMVLSRNRSSPLVDVAPLRSVGRESVEPPLAGADKNIQPQAAAQTQDFVSRASVGLASENRLEIGMEEGIEVTNEAGTDQADNTGSILPRAGSLTRQEVPTVMQDPRDCSITTNTATKVAIVEGVLEGRAAGMMAPTAPFAPPSIIIGRPSPKVVERWIEPGVADQTGLQQNLEENEDMRNLIGVGVVKKAPSANVPQKFQPFDLKWPAATALANSRPQIKAPIARRLAPPVRIPEGVEIIVIDSDSEPENEPAQTSRVPAQTGIPLRPSLSCITRPRPILLRPAPPPAQPASMPQPSFPNSPISLQSAPFSFQGATAGLHPQHSARLPMSFAPAIQQPGPVFPLPVVPMPPVHAVAQIQQAVQIYTRPSNTSRPHFSPHEADGDWAQRERVFDLLKFTHNVVLREATGQLSWFFHNIINNDRVPLSTSGGNGELGRTIRRDFDYITNVINSPPRHRMQVKTRTMALPPAPQHPARAGSKRPRSPTSDEENQFNGRPRLEGNLSGPRQPVSEFLSGILMPERRLPLENRQLPDLLPPNPYTGRQVDPPTGPRSQQQQPQGVMMLAQASIERTNSLVTAKATANQRQHQLPARPSTGGIYGPIMTPFLSLLEDRRNVVNHQVHHISIAQVVDAVYFARYVVGLGGNNGGNGGGRFYHSPPPAFTSLNRDGLPFVNVLLNTPTEFMLNGEHLAALEKMLLFVFNVGSFEEIDVSHPSNTAKKSYEDYLMSVQRDAEPPRRRR